MGDKFRSEIQKPVKNPLLSGAGHGFPFENFQGSSLLVPVSQDSPSVLNDDVGEEDKFVGQEPTNYNNPIDSLPQSVELLSLDTRNESNQPQQVQQSSNQGYSGIFSTFFGGSQNKQEQDSFNIPKSTSDTQINTGRSNSPYVPRIQSYSPSLQVPAVTPTPPPNSNTDIPASNPFPPPIGGNLPQTGGTLPPPGSNLPPSGGNLSLSGASASKYRLGHHKKLAYAPVPGLTSTTHGPSMIQGAEGSSNQQPSVLQPTIFNPALSNPSFNQQQENQSLSQSYSFPSFNNLPPTNQASNFFSSGNNFPPQVPSSEPTNLPPPPSQTPTEKQNLPPPPSSSISGNPPASTSIGVNPSPISFGGNPAQTAFGQISPLSSSFGINPTEKPNLPPPPSSNVFSGNTPPLSSNTSYGPPPSSSAFSGNPSQTPTENPNQPPPPLNSFGVNPPPSQPQRDPFCFDRVYPSDVIPFPSNSEPPSFPNFLPSYAFPPRPKSGANLADPLPFPAPVVSSSSSSIPSSSAISSSSDNLSASQSQPSLFLPISNANLNPSPPASIFNPIPLHPSTSAPIMSTMEQSSSGSSVQAERPPSIPIVPPSLNNLANMGQSGIIYRPVYHHWFYKKESDVKEVWQPFSMTDSLALEQAYNSGLKEGFRFDAWPHMPKYENYHRDLNQNTVIATDGGRYDVNILEKRRHAVYWEEEPKEVRRCSWFYKNTTESRFRPYDENTAFMLELEYKNAVTTNSWKRKIELSAGEHVILFGPNSMAHFPVPSPSPDSWEATPGTELSQASQTRPRIVKRGVLDDFEIDDGEPQKVDHLLFVVHGIGSVCDLKFRKIEEAVDSFRSHAHQLIKSHFKSSVEQGYINRVEILPVSWHSHLHGDATGVDKKLQTITLKSIPKLRHFTNDTLLDILFYTSPVYCQNMMQQVGQEMNKLFEKFKSRNPGFYGGVSLAGHSLGSLILFDMLCHQKPPNDECSSDSRERSTTPVDDRLSPGADERRRLSRNVSYVMGTAGTGQPFITYPQLNFHPTAFFAMGSPIGMFVTVRGIDSLGLDFKLPTCPGFFNIFHPFDPVAYRIEALINPELSDKRPVLIPHHKGRKRMHLELKETMAKVGADLKQRIIDSMRSTWNTVYQLTTFGRADDNLEQEVGEVIEKQLERQRTESISSGLNEFEDLEFNSGCLNQGRRIDYVLQEAPLESLNEYVSAITSHVTYWDSEDTVLLIIKEIYATMGVSPDNPQCGRYAIAEDIPTPPSPSFQAQNWNFPNNNNNNNQSEPQNTSSSVISPPPISGFVRN